MSIVSIPFLVCLGINLLIVGVLFMFFTQRLNEQNHKISAMTGIVTTMVEELYSLRDQTNRLKKVETLEKKPEDGIRLISVSDDEDDDKDYDDDEDDLDELNDDIHDDNDDDDDDELDNLEEAENDTRVINLGDGILLNCIVEEDDLEDNLDDLELDDEDKKIDFQSIKSIDISNTNLEETKDYKKMTTSKLKEFALAKGLITENTKITKNQIVKLLESSSE